MQKHNWKLPLLTLVGALYSTAAFADIFDELGTRAQFIGEGLTSVGFVIAAIGLIVFTFMAIFNKLSWKSLAYIMMGCFFLSFMSAIIEFVREGGDKSLNVSTSSASGSESEAGKAGQSKDPTKNAASKTQTGTSRSAGGGGSGSSGGSF